VKHKPKIIAIVFFTFLITTCSQPQPAGIPEHLLEIVEANRAIALPPFPDDFAERADIFLTQGLTSGEDLRISKEKSQVRIPGQHIREIRPENNPVASISQEDATKDITFLFDLMKYGYAGYQYFGGDEIFLPIRNSMLERLANMPEVITGTTLLRDILVPGLGPVIADNHFQLHDVTLEAPRLSARINEEFVLRKINDDFITVIDTVEYKFVEATFLEQKVDGILPTLTRGGEVVFVFGHFAAWDQLGPKPLSVLLENVESGKRRLLEVRLQVMASPGMDTIVFHESKRNGIPVVVNRTLQDPYLTIDATKTFYESGESLRGSPVIVLDLRGHSGGISSSMENWIYGLTGNRPSGRAFEIFSLVSRTADRFTGSLPIWTKSTFSEVLTLPLSNKNLVIVLTDTNMASAGDLIVGHLREFENVVFVGTNTRGMLVTGEIVRNVLPRSNITVVFGTQLHLRPDFSQFEGVGFLPDLWVPPTESLERVLAFIERYGLANK